MGVCSSDSADEAEDVGYPVIAQEDARIPAQTPVRTSLVPKSVPIEVSHAPLLCRRARLLQAAARRMSNREVVELKVHRICTAPQAVTACLDQVGHADSGTNRLWKVLISEILDQQILMLQVPCMTCLAVPLPDWLRG